MNNCEQHVNTSIGILKGRERLERDLRHLIQSGTQDFSKPISTEMELAEAYKISRNTVRKALQILTNEGLLYKRHGLGTFVVQPEDRSPKHVRLNKILLIIPYSGGPPASLNVFDRKLFAGVADYAFLNNVQLEVRGYTDSKAKLLDQFRNLKFDGIIWERPETKYYPVIKELHHHKVPQVTISRQIEGVPVLFFDYESGMRDVVRFLQGIGHRKIVFIDLNRQEPVFTDRRRVFKEELRKSGFENPDHYVYESALKKLTETQLDEIFHTHSDLSAIFFSAVQTTEIWEYLQKRKIKIPRDLSLISLGENDYSAKLGELSSLYEPREQIGRRAAELIRLQKTYGKLSAEPEYLRGELIIRGSCLSPSHILEKQLA